MVRRTADTRFLLPHHACWLRGLRRLCLLGRASLVTGQCLESSGCLTNICGCVRARRGQWNESGEGGDCLPPAPKVNTIPQSPGGEGLAPERTGPQTHTLPQCHCPATLPGSQLRQRLPRGKSHLRGSPAWVPQPALVPLGPMGPLPDLRG